VATRPTQVNGLGLPPTEVKRKVDQLLLAFELLADPVDLVSRWLALCERYQVAGRPAHDTRLVALMGAHSVTHLLTLNTADFQRYAEITVLDPRHI
jgi:hypothetical protein